MLVFALALLSFIGSFLCAEVKVAGIHKEAQEAFAHSRHQKATVKEKKPLIRAPKRTDLPDKARDKKISPVSTRFSGYISCLLFGDTRQVVGGGDAFYAVLPEKRILDACDKDVNGQGMFNASVLETRMRAEVHGPEILGARSFGYWEGDLFGSRAFLNRFRIRHAYIKLLWDSASLIFGQFWHPLYVTHAQCYPNTIGFSGGAPMETLARQPQLRFTKEWKHVRCIAAAMTQMSFVNNGPEGFKSMYMRNAIVPNISALIHGFSSEENVVGIGANYKRIVPRLVSNNNVKVHESLSSVSVIGFASGLIGDVHIASKVGYLQNATDLLALGGYAVSAVNCVTDERSYANTRDAIAWLDIELHKKWSPGIFVGYTKNLGATKPIMTFVKNTQAEVDEPTLYPLFDGDTDYVVRVTPRLRVHVQQVVLAGEINWVRAAYGAIGPKGKVTNTNPVSKMRIAMGTYFLF